jgi:hypothetical protein
MHTFTRDMTTETFAGTLPAIQRTADHTYIWTDPTTGIVHRLPGVTGLLGIISKGYALDNWRDRTISEAAIELHRSGVLAAVIETVGDKGAIGALREAAKEKRDVAGRLGSEVHRMADEINAGRVPEGIDKALAYANAYREWRDASGWRLRLSEAIVIFPSQGYGGTFDSLWYDADGKTVLADVKTGSVYREAILQLTAYGLCPLVSPMGSDTVYPMPHIDRYVVLDVKPEGVRPIDINVGQAELMAWADVLDLHKWQQSVKGKL